MKFKFDVKDPATWRGIVALLGAFGLVVLPPEEQEKIVTAVLTLVGLIGTVFVKEESK
jgi:uncharacterized membrane protein